MPSKKTTLPLIGNGTPARSFTVSNQNIINFYLTIETNTEANTLTKPYYAKPAAVYSTPGTTYFSTTPNLGQIRGFCPLNDVLYLVSGSIFYGLGTSGNYVNLGSLNTFSGNVSIQTDGDQIGIVDGVNGYTYNLTTNVFAQITDANFPIPAPVICAQQTFRLIVFQPESNTLWTSALNDYTAYSQANIDLFANAASDGQDIVAVFINQYNLLVFKKFNTEIWQLTQNNGFPYAPIQGSTLDNGCVAPFSIAIANNQPIWLSQNSQGNALVLTMSNYQCVNILDEDSQNLISELTTITDAEGYTFQMYGHLFYVLNFPTENRSFILDIRTGVLTQLASWYVEGHDQSGNPNYALGRHLSHLYTFWNGQHIVGDYRGGGVLLTLQPEVYTDYNCGYDNSIYREIECAVIHDNKNRIFLDDLEIEMETGVSPVQTGNTTAINQPLLNISTSDDYGQTFNRIESVSMGTLGQYTQRVKLFKLGNARQWVIKLNSSHPQFTAILQMFANLSVGNS